MKKKDNFFEEYRELKINTIHSFIIYGLLLDVFLILKTFFEIDIYIESVVLRIIVYLIIPFTLGEVKVIFIDPFFDKISVKIKWIFVFLVFGVLVFMGVYSWIFNFFE